VRGHGYVFDVPTHAANPPGVGEDA